jgi:hypothetical protein
MVGRPDVLLAGFRRRRQAPVRQPPPWIGGGMMAAASLPKENPNTTLAVLKGVLGGTAL